MNPTSPNPASPQKKPIHGTFCAEITQATAGRMSHWLAVASQKPASEVHILFQSMGGGVAEGIMLHNLFKAYPLPLVVYNGGSIQSIATIAYLGARRRVVSRHGLFMLHRTTFSPPAATSDILKELGGMADLEDRRTREILAESIKLEDRNWDNLRNNQFWFTAEDAVKSGIATEIGEFSAPAGCELWSFAT